MPLGFTAFSPTYLLGNAKPNIESRMPLGFTSFSPTYVLVGREGEMVRRDVSADTPETIGKNPAAMLQGKPVDP